MALEIKQQLRQTQQLVMTPQLQQAIKLLQYNHLEMVDAVEQELKENPLLEVSSFDEPFTEAESRQQERPRILEDMVKRAGAPDERHLRRGLGELPGELWRRLLSRHQRDFSDRPPLENMATYQETLFQYLLQQLQLSHIEGEDRRIALEIIGNVDENGYLDVESGRIGRALCNVPSEGR